MSIEEKRRAAFERWAEDQGLNTKRDGVVVAYAYRHTDNAWLAVIEHEGELCTVRIPDERKALALQLLRSVFDDGVIQASALPPEWVKVPLNEASKL